MVIRKRRGRPPNPELIEAKGVRYSCTNPNCNKTFKNEDSRRVHVTYTCNQPPRFKCGYCNYKSHRISNVKAHLTAKHSAYEMNVIELYKTPFKTGTEIFNEN